MIKINNVAINPDFTTIAQAFGILMLLVNLCTPVYANNPSTIKKPKSASNFNSQEDAIKNWFNNYDQIRRQAQLSAAERQKADEIMGKGLSIFMPGADKVLAQNLLTNLVNRYDIAVQQLASLPIVPATEQLHRAYYQYFVDARHLFSDYLQLQNDLLATDPTTGQPVASGLVERKENLAILDQNNKALDERLRQQYAIPAYQYQSSLSQPQTQYQTQYQYQSASPQQPPVGAYPPSYQSQPNY